MVDLGRNLTLISISKPFTVSNRINQAMNSFFAVITLFTVLALCGLGDKLKESSNPPASNSAATAPTAAPTKKPLDREALKNELSKMENDMTEAAMNGDITQIARYTTDDFELTGADGKVQNKNQALADVKKERNVRGWAIVDTDLVSASEDSAVLRYTLNVTLKTGQSGRARVTDTFVKKNGQWMIQSEQQTMIK